MFGLRKFWRCTLESLLADELKPDTRLEIGAGSCMVVLSELATGERRDPGT